MFLSYEIPVSAEKNGRAGMTRLIFFFLKSNNQVLNAVSSSFLKIIGFLSSGNKFKLHLEQHLTMGTHLREAN
ncbi:hypothetical protein B6I21_09075 [candidate division KSB1 bacterium 4572_119]|nr:MAG: hypothetical protein B6I21_09075 [candidate division KSB1 bacterium 4572_119]